MSYLVSNIPYFKCWVRKEFTHNHEQYHGEYLHAMAFAVNTVPDRCLSFQVVFTGCESDFDDNKYVSYKVDYKLLNRILKGPRFAHWNNAEIGSHIEFSRRPEIYERKLYYSMSFFHA